MLFDDGTVNDIYSRYSKEIHNPQSGDLIFMSNTQEVSHIALFKKKENGKIYFIDSFSTDGIVEEREYNENDSRFISFRRMMVSTN
jgi:hypothetical protein